MRREFFMPALNFLALNILIWIALAAAPLAAQPRFLDLEPADGSIQTEGEVRLRGRVSPEVTRLSIDSKDIAVTDGVFETEVHDLSEGAKVFVLIAYDAEGERDERLHRVVRDSRGPRLSLARPSRGVTSEASLRFVGTASDPHLERVVVDGRPATLKESSFEAVVELHEGEQRVVIEAWDTVGTKTFLKNGSPSTHVRRWWRYISPAKP